MTISNGSEHQAASEGVSVESQVFDRREKAHSLAIEANRYFDRRLYAALIVAEYPFDDASPDGEASGPDRLDGKLLRDEERFSLENELFLGYKALAETVMPPRAAFDNVSNTQTEAKEYFEDPSIYEELSAEQLEKVARIKAALADKFDRDETDFGVIKVEWPSRPNDPDYLVALTATEGVDVGNPDKVYNSNRGWDRIMENPEDARFLINVDGQQIDTRTRVVLSSLTMTARANPNINEVVWLTGAKHNDELESAPTAKISNGMIEGRMAQRGFDTRTNILFRPVVSV